VRDDVWVTRIDDRGPAIALDASARRRLAAVLHRNGVVAASLIGSQATGTAGPLSDVDVAVWLDPQLSPEQRLALRLEISAAGADALGTEEIDVVVLNDAPPLLQHRARQGSMPLVDRDPRTRVRLESRALVEYLDTQHLRDELARGVRNRIAEGRFGRR
jgi:predicted nucleotidyltransferase